MQHRDGPVPLKGQAVNRIMQRLVDRVRGWYLRHAPAWYRQLEQESANRDE